MQPLSRNNSVVLKTPRSQGLVSLEHYRKHSELPWCVFILGLCSDTRPHAIKAQLHTHDPEVQVRVAEPQTRFNDFSLPSICEEPLAVNKPNP